MPIKAGAEYLCSLCGATAFTADPAGPPGWEMGVTAFGLAAEDACDECAREYRMLTGWLRRGRRGPRDMDAGTTLRTLPRDEGRGMDLAGMERAK